METLFIHKNAETYLYWDPEDIYIETYHEEQPGEYTLAAILSFARRTSIHSIPIKREPDQDGSLEKIIRPSLTEKKARKLFSACYQEISRYEEQPDQDNYLAQEPRNQYNQSSSRDNYHGMKITKQEDGALRLDSGNLSMLIKEDAGTYMIAHSRRDPGGNLIDYSLRKDLPFYAACKRARRILSSHDPKDDITQIYSQEISFR